MRADRCRVWPLTASSGPGPSNERCDPGRRRRGHGPHRASCAGTRNPYVFRGLIYCAACDRRMQGQYNHGDAYYRCRFPQEYALANQIPHPRNAHRRTTLA
ncbi:zinc ribbon domain-containing protein [Micromonospora chalcea]|uniref:zinc ribbon domain-containing protein n=1 Tax=Micromonospora TaxID=1873 RepID=UPI0032AFFE67